MPDINIWEGTPQPQASTSQLSVPMELPIADLSYKWNHTIKIIYIYMEDDSKPQHLIGGEGSIKVHVVHSNEI